jgi:hypothetical protein
LRAHNYEQLLEVEKERLVWEGISTGSNYVRLTCCWWMPATRLMASFATNRNILNANEDCSFLSRKFCLKKFIQRFYADVGTHVAMGGAILFTA